MKTEICYCFIVGLSYSLQFLKIRDAYDFRKSACGRRHMYHKKILHWDMFKPIPHTKQNSEISTDIIDNDVIMLKFERFSRKALSFKRLSLSSL